MKSNIVRSNQVLVVSLLAALPLTAAMAQSSDLTVGDTGGLRPSVPQLMARGGLRQATSAEARVLFAGRQAAFGNDCTVDFSESYAISLLPNYAGDTFAYAPWWIQVCNGAELNLALMRPLEYSHFHLNFQDSDITCLDFGTGWFGRPQPDGSCEAADVLNEPRYLRSHIGDERIHLYTSGEIPSASTGYDDSALHKGPFDLKRVRVKGETPVRLCYLKVQELDGPWITSPDVEPATSPGVWLCWNQLGPGLWDLSQWAGNVREVKITATNGATPFSVDDILIAVP